MAQNIPSDQVQQCVSECFVCVFDLPGVLLDYHVVLLFSGDPQVGVVYAHHTPLDQSELVWKKIHKTHDLKVCHCAC